MMERKRKKGGAWLVKNEPTQRTKKEKIRLAVILTLAVLLAALVTVFAVYRFWAKPPEIPSEKPPVQTGQQSGNENVDRDEEEFVIEGVETIGDRKKDFYTFLIVGRDTGGGGNTDTILLAAYDIPNQKLNVMSIPRDTMVNIPYDIKRINAVYSYSGSGDKGIQALYREVSQLVGFIPDYKIVMEWSAIGDLVEAIDGVWFNVPRDMDYDDATQDLHIHVKAGYQLLSGEDAMGVIRWRHNNDGTGYATGDIGRIETQQAFLKAVIAQCLQMENVTKIREFAQVFSNNVQTDLTLGNLVWFAEQAAFGGLSIGNVNFITMPGDYAAEAWSRVYQNMQSYVLPDADKLLAVVNESFNPYLEARKLQGLDIMLINEDGSVSSTTGKIEDEKAARPPVIPKPEPQPEPEQMPEPDVSETPVVSDQEPERSEVLESSPEPVPTPETTLSKEELPLTEGNPVLPPMRAAA